MANLKNIKKGDKVILRLFSGAFSGVKEVEKADANYIYFETGKGKSKFSKKTGKMIEPAPKSERFASYIEEYDAKIAAAEAKKKQKKEETSKKPVKKVAAPKSAQKDPSESKAAPKKPVKKVVKRIVRKAAKEEVEELD